MLKKTILLLVAVNLAACGGSSDSAGGPATPTANETPVSPGGDSVEPEPPVSALETDSVPSSFEGSESIMPPGVPKLDI